VLLPEREMHVEISINWVLDQEIPKGGYVRILAESLLWEERLGKTRIRILAESLLWEERPLSARQVASVSAQLDSLC